MNRMCCFDCPRRQVGCHAKCPDYAAFAEEGRRRREAEFKKTIADGYIIEQELKNRRQLK